MKLANNKLQKKTTGKANQKTNKEAKREKTQEVHKEKLTPDRTVLLLKKIIGNQKKRAAKDKKKFSKVLRSASADARKYKLILNKVTKNTTCPLWGNAYTREAC